jgi:hypothetical protein
VDGEEALDTFVALQVLTPTTIGTLFVLILLPTVGLLIYHTLRQLHWVSRIYTHWTRVLLVGRCVPFPQSVRHDDELDHPRTSSSSPIALRRTRVTPSPP